MFCDYHFPLQIAASTSGVSWLSQVLTKQRSAPFLQLPVGRAEGGPWPVRGLRLSHELLQHHHDAVVAFRAV